MDLDEVLEQLQADLRLLIYLNCRKSLWYLHLPGPVHAWELPRGSVIQLAFLTYVIDKATL